jgi:hypothetical protein
MLAGKDAGFFTIFQLLFSLLSVFSTPASISYAKIHTQ